MGNDLASLVQPPSEDVVLEGEEKFELPKPVSIITWSQDRRVRFAATPGVNCVHRRSAVLRVMIEAELDSGESHSVGVDCSTVESSKGALDSERAATEDWMENWTRRQDLP